MGFRAPPSPVPEPDPPLAGRERELVAARAALAALLAGRGSLVLIGGEAGIGKTALAEAICAEAIERGAAVLVGRCYDLAETPPYGPWRELFAAAPRDGDLPALPDALLATGGAGEAFASREAIVARVRDYLAALAGRTPLVLFLDDLHWADPASLETLRIVARGVGALPVLLVVAYRAEELGRGHPLHALLPALVREARALRLDLSPLTDRDLGALVAARYALGERDAARLVAHLRERAQGNPFYAGEILRALEETRALEREPGGQPAGYPLGGGAPPNGSWRLGALDEARVPALLRRVLDARLARLGEEAERLLAVAAVIGQAVPLDLWAAVAETDEAGLDATIERALAARVLEESPGGTGLRFAHALLREALYEGIGLPRRRRWHGRAAEALLARADPDPDAVAGHLRRAGDPRAAGWLAVAGERAQRAYAWLTAAERYAAALALSDTHDRAERGWLALRLGWLCRLDDPPRSLAYMDEAAQLADGDPALAAYARFSRGVARGNIEEVTIAPAERARGDTGWRVDNKRVAIADLEQGIAAMDRLAPPDAAELRSWLARYGLDTDDPRGTLAHYLALVGRCAEAEDLAERVLERPPEPRPAGAIGGSGYADACLALAEIHTQRGEPAAARAAYARAREALRALGDPHQVGWASINELWYVVLPYQADQLAAREQVAADAERDLARTGDMRPHLSPRRARLHTLALEGRWDEALEDAPPGGNTGILLAGLRGDFDLAWANVRARLPRGPASAPGGCNFSQWFPILRIAAGLALATGDLPAACAWLEANDRWLDWSGAVPGRADGLAVWAAYHRAAGDLAAARRHADMALARATEPRQPLALLAAHRALGEIDTATGRHAAASDHLAAALGLADACAAPYERALTLLARAELHAATGAPDDARSDLVAARATFAALGARPALARADALAARLATAHSPAASGFPAGLSAREREVLRLVAEGLTDPQVAERLSLARRTIGSHLNSIYTKLGVNTRTAAARAARERGIL